LAVLWCAYQNTEIGLRCAFGTDIQVNERTPWINQQYIPPEFAPGGLPVDGDRITWVGRNRIHTWSDFVRTLADLRDEAKNPRVEVPADATLADLERLPRHADAPVVRRGGQELVRVEFERGDPANPQPISCWCRVGTPPPEEFVQSLVWFFVKLSLLVVVAIVFWKRPDDDATFRFFLLCIVTIGAFMGGYHWLRIAGSPPLIVIFMICAVLLPVVSLHFYLVFPRPKPFYQRRPRTTLALLYGVPGLLLAGMLATYAVVVWTYRGGWSPATVQAASRWLLNEIYIALVVAAGLFLGCVVSLVHSFRTSRPGSLERNQVKWIMTGALLATVPIGYTLYLAVTDTDRFGLGGATWPMFAASLCFTVAYGVSISRYGLMEVRQALNWGILSIIASVAAGLVYSGFIFLSTLVIGSQIDRPSPFRQAAWVSFTAWLLLLGLDLFRWQLRKTLDRRLHRAKYQLDRTLRRMSDAVEKLVDPPTLAHRFLQTLAELLAFRQGAVYLREGDPPLYRLAAHLGVTPPLDELPPGSPLADALEQQPLVRCGRERPAPTPAGRQLALLGGEIAVPLRHEGTPMAVLLLGPRDAGGYEDDDLHLLTTFTQMAALALHSARGHETIERLNRDLQAKVEKISEQQRRIMALQGQLLRQTAREADAGGNALAPAPTAAPAAGLVGSSPAVQHLLQVVRKVAASPSAVLIRGESGTGKELLARALHDHSPRAGKAFVKVHCAALAPGLLESELFGHVKGAFTGAHRDKVGRFELANGGTLFLDEIGDITPEVQTKLLRVLQEMTFERVGSSEPVHVDVRIIAATNQNLEQLMRDGRFREDLFYRLNVITIRTPPLRDRREDICELALHFLKLYAHRSGKTLTHIEDEALEALKAYHWPGNVRELENVIERAVVLADGPAITPAELPDEIPRSAEEPEPHANGVGPLAPAGADLTLPQGDWSAHQHQRERDRLVRALAAAAGNKAQAARALGMPRSTFISKLEKYGLILKRPS
jgi:transcriptional regulator with GAF, ATPase, and Fis domain